MLELRQSTAITVKIGPFLDETDGKTAEDALTIAQADVRLSKNGGDIAQKTEATSCTHDELGVYGCPLDVTDTGTLGRLQLWVHESGALPVWHEFMVLPQQVWDSLYGSDKLQVDVVEKSSAALDLTTTEKASVNVEADQALTDYDPPTKAEMDTAHGLLATVTALATAQADLDNPTQYKATGFSTHVAADVWAVGTRTLTSFGTLVADIWNALTSGLTQVGSIGKLLVDNINATISSRSSHDDPDPSSYIDAAISTRATPAQVNTEVDTALTDYDPPTKAELDSGLAGLNDISPAEVNAEVDTALETYRLDELMAIALESQPVSGSLLGDLTEDDGGTQRFNQNALEQAPTGGTNPNVLVSTTIVSVTSQTEFVLTAGSNDDDAYDDQSIVVYDASDNDYPSVRKVTSYVGSTKTVTIDSAPDFTIISGDGVNIFVTAPGTTAPTAAQNADAVWDEAIVDHQGAGSFGAKSQKVVPSETLDDYKADVSNLDVTVSSRAPSGEYDTEMGTGERASAAALATAQADLDDPAQYKATGFSTHSAAAVWAVGARTLTSFGTLIQDIWDKLTSGLTQAGSIGKLLVDNINAAISSRSSHDDPDPSGYIDSAISGRAPSGEYDTQMGTGERASATALATAQADLDNPAQYKADVSSLALEATLAIVDGIVDDIVADTNELQTDWADGGRLDLLIDALALEATLATVDGIVDDILLDTAALEKIATNRWKVVTNQLIVYDDDDVTPLYTFNLKDSVGDPAMENVYERVPA